MSTGNLSQTIPTLNILAYLEIPSLVVYPDITMRHFIKSEFHIFLSMNVFAQNNVNSKSGRFLKSNIPIPEMKSTRLHDECNNYMTRWFCDRGPECRTDNLGQALQLAMKHIRQEYQTILVHDDIPGSLNILSKLFPSFFNVDNYVANISLPTVHPSKQPPPSAETIALLESLNVYDKKLHTFILGLHRIQTKRCND